MPASTGADSPSKTPVPLKTNPAISASGAGHSGSERMGRRPRAAKTPTATASRNETISLAAMNHSSVTNPILRVTDPIADRYPIDVAAFDSPKPHAEITPISEANARMYTPSPEQYRPIVSPKPPARGVFAGKKRPAIHAFAFARARKPGRAGRKNATRGDGSDGRHGFGHGMARCANRAKPKGGNLLNSIVTRHFVNFTDTR